MKKIQACGYLALLGVVLSGLHGAIPELAAGILVALGIRAYKLESEWIASSLDTAERRGYQRALDDIRNERS